MPSTSIFTTKLTAFLFCATVLLLSACGGGGGGGSSGGGAGQSNLQGLAYKGPVAQGTLKVYILNQDGTRTTTPIASAITDENGRYQLQVPILVDTPVDIVLTGGSYVDEATGNVVSLRPQDQLEAYTNVPANGILTAQVTPLTTLAAALSRRLRSVDGQSLSVSMTNATSEISYLFAVDNILTVSPPPISQVAISAPAQRDYAFYLAGFSQLAKNNSISVFDIISGMADDLESNGILNDTVHIISPADLAHATEQFIQGLNNISITILSPQSVAALTASNVDPAKIYLASKTNSPPIANDVAITTEENTPANGVLIGSDPDSADILTYSIVSNGAKGTAVVTDAFNGNFTYTPNQHANGTDAFTYLVSDGLNGIYGTVSITINSINDPPTAGNISVNTIENTAVQGVLAGNDVDGNTLAYSIVSAPSKGQITFNASSGIFTYTPNQGDIGIDSFTYDANDGSLNSNIAIVTITIIPVSSVPAANSFGTSTDEDTPVNGTLQAIDNDSPVLTYSLVTNAIKGTAVITNATSGSFTYTPDLNANGIDTFTFKANDGANDSNIATVTISITAVNDAPVANSGAFITNENTPGTGTLSATDVDSPLLVYSIVSNGAKGTATITNPVTGAYTYTPNANANGSDSFTFKANDGLLDSNTGTISVTITIPPINNPPVITSTAVTTATQNVLYSYQVTATDPDDNTLTYSLTTSPSGMIITPSSGLISWTPTGAQVGKDKVTVKVTDNGTNPSNLSATQSFTINVAKNGR